jgi:ribosome maturation factor RimP
MPSMAELEQLFAPPLEALGYDVVRVTMGGAVKMRTLQVMAERKDRRNMTVEDCAEVSRVLSALLDVEDPIQGSYSLEVSSPGIDRPLTRPADYTRFAGFEARVETRQPIEGRRRFRGRLKGVEADRVIMDVLDVEDSAVAIAIPLSDIERAKLVLTDELIKKSTQGRE